MYVLQKSNIQNGTCEAGEETPSEKQGQEKLPSKVWTSETYHPNDLILRLETEENQ